MRFLPLMVVLCLCALPGCGNASDVWGTPQDRAKIGEEGPGLQSFEIGPASKWARPGLYLDYAASHKVALKSDYGMLVAILLVSPETGSTVRYDRTSNIFKDPQNGGMYTVDGVKWGGDADRTSLPRCRIRHLGPLDDPQVGLVVDPSKLFYQEQQQWSKAASNHLFVDSDSSKKP